MLTVLSGRVHNFLQNHLPPTLFVSTKAPGSSAIVTSARLWPLEPCSSLLSLLEIHTDLVMKNTVLWQQNKSHNTCDLISKGLQIMLSQRAPCVTWIIVLRTPGRTVESLSAAIESSGNPTPWWPLAVWMGEWQQRKHQQTFGNQSSGQLGSWGVHIHNLAVLEPAKAWGTDEKKVDLWWSQKHGLPRCILQLWDFRFKLY